MSHLGIGVMINMLAGNAETVAAITRSTGKVITSVNLDDNTLLFKFEDSGTLAIWDNGQSCCENRYMVTADKLEEFARAMPDENRSKF